MSKTVYTRREALQVLTTGTLALYLLPTIEAFAEEEADRKKYGAAEEEFLRSSNPIDRTLQEEAPHIFFGDLPERAHAVLWNKGAYLPSGSNVPPHEVDLCIIGGGLGGLTTAYLLRKHNPIILEQAHRFGGNPQGQSWRGIDYSIGAAYFVRPEEESEIGKFTAELGIDKKWKVKSGREPYELQGRVSYDFWEEKRSAEYNRQAAILKRYFQTVNEGESISYPDIPVVDNEQWPYIKGLDQLSFKERLENMVGGKLDAVIETAMEHYCYSSFAASMSEISAASGINFYAAEFGEIVVLPGGNSAVTEALFVKLAKTLPENSLKPSSIVFDVKVDSQGVLVSYLDSAGVVQGLRAKTAVLSCPKFVVSKILQGIEPERQEAIAKLRYRSYLVANVLLKGTMKDKFYDLYLLGKGNSNSSNVRGAAEEQKVTDVVFANYALNSSSSNLVLTLYRAFPYDGARAELYAGESYERYRKEFEKQINEEILPLLKLEREQVAEIRITRWGHPLPVAAKGLIADGIIEKIRKPFGERVFFVEQDNWALPAFETSVSEALHWAPLIAKVLERA